MLGSKKPLRTPLVLDEATPERIDNIMKQLWVTYQMNWQPRIPIIGNLYKAKRWTGYCNVNNR